MHLYEADPDWPEELARELSGCAATAIAPGLWAIEGEPVPSAWAAQIWFDAVILPCPSIAAGAAALRERGAWWLHRPLASVRRGELIAEKLLDLRLRPSLPPWPKPPRAIGQFALLDDQRLLAAAHCHRPCLSGVPLLSEDRDGPPSRAYRKLAEACLLLGRHPGPGETVLELGASPGGWTWLLARCGAQVIAVDRAPLEPRIAALPGVETRLGSAFAIGPGEVACEWLISDVICYPERLLDYLRRWLAGGGCRKWIITLKFQGDSDHAAAIAAARELTEVQVVHLHHNKHEVTLLAHPGLGQDPRPRPWPWLAS